MSKTIRRFLIGSGWVLSAMGLIRVYRLIRSHGEDPLFAPQLLLTLLSLWIASSILRVGLRNKEMTRKGAIALIRSGSVLATIWGYRLYLVLNRKQDLVDVRIQFYFALFYLLFGMVVMCLGLKISRGLRKKRIEASPSTDASFSSAAFSDDLTKK